VEFAAFDRFETISHDSRRVPAELILPPSKLNALPSDRNEFAVEGEKLAGRARRRVYRFAMTWKANGLIHPSLGHRPRKSKPKIQGCPTHRIHPTHQIDRAFSPQWWLDRKPRASPWAGICPRVAGRMRLAPTPVNAKYDVGRLVQSEQTKLLEVLPVEVKRVA